MRPAIFLDRDGTLMEEVSYCSDPAHVRVFPSVPQALQSLQAAGYLLVIVTNQSGIGRGYFTEANYRAVHAEFERQILPAHFHAAYFCPDAPETPSDCRKPAPGMLQRAAREHSIDLSRSYMVGDKAIDMECGRAAGCRTGLVLTGYGRKQQTSSANVIAETFADIAKIILSTS